MAIQGRKRLPARARLPIIVALSLLPAMMIAGWLATRSAASERAQIERNLDQKVREIAIEINRELAIARGVLAALASSHFLQIEDFEAFHGQALEIARQLNMVIVVRDATLNEQIINTALPWGAPRLRGEPAEIRDDPSMTAGQYDVSNVFFGRALNQFVVGIRTPVHRNAPLAYFIGATIPTDRFATILRETDFRPEHLASIVDRNNVIVARSQRHAELVGKPLLSDLRHRAAAPAGTETTINREGIVYHWSWRRLEGSDWLVSVGVPESVLEASSRTILLSYGGASVLLLAAATGLAYGWGRRMSIGALGVDRQPTGEEFRILFESAPNGVLVADHEGRIVLLNADVERTFGYSRDELLGQPIETLMPGRLGAPHSQHRTAFMKAPAARPMGIGRELCGRRKDGTEFPIEISLNPIGTHGGGLVMATVVDITHRKQATDRLAATLRERDELRRRLMQAQEEERLRLARELHDQTGQSLTAVMLELKSIENQMIAPDRQRLRSLRQELEEMGHTLHRVAWELRPASIDELGLAVALSNYVSEWAEQYGVEADFHCGVTGLEDLSVEIKTTFYRIAQEALTNIAKHARSVSSVSVILERSDSMVQLTIEDNGCGFDPAGSAGDRRGLGLAGMRERLSIVGGELEIESSTGGGTTVYARVPLSAQGATA